MVNHSASCLRYRGSRVIFLQIISNPLIQPYYLCWLRRRHRDNGVRSVFLKFQGGTDRIVSLLRRIKGDKKNTSIGHFTSLLIATIETVY